jgi:hypothetical protein
MDIQLYSSPVLFPCEDPDDIGQGALWAPRGYLNVMKRTNSLPLMETERHYLSLYVCKFQRTQPDGTALI